MTSIDDYLALITPWHSTRPKFMATVAATVGPYVALSNFLAALPAAFDIANAVGVQLDAVGIRVGQSRQLPYPIEGVFFSLDDPVRGFDKGIWKGPYDTDVGIYRLDDDTYRRLLYSKILANNWDGTKPGAQNVLDAYFTDPETLVFVEDDGWNAPSILFSFDDPARGFDIGLWAQPDDIVDPRPLDMTITIGIAGKLPNLVDLGLLGQGAFPIKPEGVAMQIAVTSVNKSPLFGFDVQNQYISGFDTGAFGVSPDFIAANAIQGL